MRHSSDNLKMVQFVSRCLPDGQGRLILARNSVDDEIYADVIVCEDDIDIASNCPEWVSLREVYDHLRWQSMPAWEQMRWLGLQRRVPHLPVEQEHAPYSFQKIGEIWGVHFSVDGVVKQGYFKNHKGFQHYAQLLANPDKVIQSVELADEANSRTLALIENERHFVGIDRHDQDSLDDYTKVLDLLYEKHTSAKMNGHLEVMEEVQSQIDELEGMLSPGRKLGSRLSMKSVGRQKLGKSNTALTIHKAVGTAMRRALKVLNDEGMSDLARFLATFVNPEGNGYAYRPIAMGPAWKL